MKVRILPLVLTKLRTMNIDNLTFGEVKMIQSLFSQPTKDDSSILASAIGKYVIVRSSNEGINCGKVLQADHTGVVLEDARRIYYHKPKDRSTAWYEGVAKSGLSSDSKISCVTDIKYIVEKYSLTLCTKEAEQSLRNYEATKTTC